MSWRSPVVWSQGMFLQPHHFQQEARYVERLVDARARCHSPHALGFRRTGARRRAARARPGRHRTRERRAARRHAVRDSAARRAAAPLEIAADLKNEIIYLALPLAREGVTEVDFGGWRPTDLCRLEAVEENVRDHTSASDEAASIQTGRLTLRLLRAKEASDAYALLGVAQVVERRSDQQVLVDRSYIPPQTSLAATDPLVAGTRLLHGLIAQRAQALAGRIGQLSHGVSELADFLMLQLLNRAEPLFRQHAEAPQIHPFTLHADCLQLAGELATLTSTARRPPEFPLYRHDDLRGCFMPLFDELRKMLSVVLEQNAVQIPLVDRTHGVRTAVVADLELARHAVFVLAVHAQLPPEQLRPRFMAQTKLGPVDRIRDLVNLQLPGIGLQSCRSRRASCRFTPATSTSSSSVTATCGASSRRPAISRCTSPAISPGSSSSCGRSAHERARRAAAHGGLRLLSHRMGTANPHEPLNDPFAALEGQRTFLMPTPGARAAAAPAPAPSGGVDVVADIGAVDSGLNPLLAIANRLLAAVPQIRSTPHLVDPGALKDSLAQGIREFEAEARQQGIAPERVMAARYILCTVLDEAAADTPWGGSGVWGAPEPARDVPQRDLGRREGVPADGQAGREPGRQPRSARADLCRGLPRLRGPLPRDRQRPRAARRGARAAGADPAQGARRLRAAACRTGVARRCSAGRCCRGCRCGFRPRSRRCCWSAPIWASRSRSAAGPTRSTARSRACALMPPTAPMAQPAAKPRLAQFLGTRSRPAWSRCATSSTAA